MPTPRSNSDTSVTFSLAELAKIEEERVHEEEQRRAADRERTARETKAREATVRAEAAARIAADEEARARRQRAEAEEETRRVARERAEVEIARIRADAQTRLDADNAARAHEIAVMRVKTEGGRRRVTSALAGALALALLGGTAWAYRSSTTVATLEQDAERLREGQAALAKEREHAKATELTALERRYATLCARPSLHDAVDAQSVVESARKAIDTKALDHDRLRAFADALDALQARLDLLDRAAALDKRKDDLVVWAAERKRVDATTAARNAGVRAKVIGDEASVRAYEVELDHLREALARETGPVASRSTGKPDNTGAAGRTCTVPGDPSCDLNGRPIF